MNFDEYEWPRNKFFSRYKNLIELAKSGKWSSYNGYSEKHHILPRCLGGGNESENLVVLPAKFHFHAHYWLMRMFDMGTREKRSMSKAFQMMGAARDYQIRASDGRIYEMVRDQVREASTGFKHTVESRKKMSEALKGRDLGESWRANNLQAAQARRGVKLSEDHKMKIVAHRIGSKDSEETKEKRASHHRGAKRSLETRRRMSEGKKASAIRRFQGLVVKDLFD